MEFYCEALIDELCSTVIINNITFQQNLIILKHLNNMRYNNIPVLNCLMKKSLKDTNTENCSIEYIDLFIKGFVIADYVPYNWEIIRRMLQNYVINTDYSMHNIVFIAYYLLSLNYYYPELIEKVFILYNNVSIIKEKHTILTILKLYWCIKLLYPEYKGVMPDENKFNQIKFEHKNNNVPYLMKSLKEAVGGAEYMKSSLKTKFGEFVGKKLMNYYN